MRRQLSQKKRRACTSAAVSCETHPRAQALDIAPKPRAVQLAPRRVRLFARRVELPAPGARLRRCWERRPAAVVHRAPCPTSGLPRAVRVKVDARDWVPAPHRSGWGGAFRHEDALDPDLRPIVPPQALLLCKVERCFLEALLGEFFAGFAQPVAVPSAVIVAEAPRNLVNLARLPRDIENFRRLQHFAAEITCASARAGGAHTRNSPRNTRMGWPTKRIDGGRRRAEGRGGEEEEERAEVEGGKGR